MYSDLSTVWLRRLADRWLLSTWIAAQSGGHAELRRVSKHLKKWVTIVDWHQLTRWQDHLFNSWPFVTTKIFPIAVLFAKVSSTFCQKLNKHWKYGLEHMLETKWRNFAESCHTVDIYLQMFVLYTKEVRNVIGLL